MLGALAAGALSAGGSLLSGLFGQSSARDQRRAELEYKGEVTRAIHVANSRNANATTALNQELRARADAAAQVPLVVSRSAQSGVDMDSFLSAARQGGFNALTFLRSGALSLFAREAEQTTTTGHNAMEAASAGAYLPTYQPEYGPIPGTRVPSTGEVVAGAFNAGIDTYLTYNSAEQANQWQRENLALGLAARNHGYRSNGFSGAPSAMLVGGTTVNGGTSALTSSNSVPSGTTFCLTETVCWEMGPGETDWEKLPVVQRYDEAGRILQTAQNAAEDWFANNPAYREPGQRALRATGDFANRGVQELISVVDFLQSSPAEKRRILREVVGREATAAGNMLFQLLPPSRPSPTNPYGLPGRH